MRESDGGVGGDGGGGVRTPKSLTIVSHAVSSSSSSPSPTDADDFLMRATAIEGGRDGRREGRGRGRQWRLAKQRKRERKSCLACNPAQAGSGRQNRIMQPTERATSGRGAARMAFRNAAMVAMAMIGRREGSD